MRDDDCACWVDEKHWFVYYGAAEPGSQKEWDPACPEHGTHTDHANNASTEDD